MRIILCCLITFSSFNSFAQSSWSTSFPVKTSFEPGDLKIYEVNELFKIDHLFLGIRSEVKSSVMFRVIDTAGGGYWINYAVNVNSVKEHKDSSAWLIASLMNGIQLLIYAKNGYLQPDSTVYFKTKARIAAELDSMASQHTFGKDNTQFIKYLQDELKKDAGLGIFLAPLIAFDIYYSSQVYKKFRITSEGRAEDILNKPLFPGSIEREWKSTSRDSTLQLNYTFTGHPVAAAQYFKSVYDPILEANNIKRGKYYYPPEIRYITDYTFKVQPGNSFPKYIYRKTVSEYLFRSVGKIEMEEMLE